MPSTRIKCNRFCVLYPSPARNLGGKWALAGGFSTSSSSQAIHALSQLTLSQTLAVSGPRHDTSMLAFLRLYLIKRFHMTLGVAEVTASFSFRGQ